MGAVERDSPRCHAKRCHQKSSTPNEQAKVVFIKALRLDKRKALEVPTKINVCANESVVWKRLQCSLTQFARGEVINKMALYVCVWARSTWVVCELSTSAAVYYRTSWHLVHTSIYYGGAFAAAFLIQPRSPSELIECVRAANKWHMWLDECVCVWVFAVNASESKTDERKRRKWFRPRAIMTRLEQRLIARSVKQRANALTAAIFVLVVVVVVGIKFLCAYLSWIGKNSVSVAALLLALLLLWFFEFWHRTRNLSHCGRASEREKEKESDKYICLDILGFSCRLTASNAAIAIVYMLWESNHMLQTEKSEITHSKTKTNEIRMDGLLNKFLLAPNLRASTHAHVHTQWVCVQCAQK